MAKVKIQGHASGTGVLTVTAPNTSTDRTITLPDSTGTILDNTSTLDATKLSGAITTSSLVVNGTNADLTLAASGNNISFARNSDNYITASGGSSSNLILDGQNRIVLKHNGTEKLRVTANGLTFNGDTAAANALSDYEEGTWTPALSGVTGNFNTSTNQIYTKIGRFVTLRGYVYNASSISDTSATWRISGLPFAPMEESANAVGTYAVNIPNDTISLCMFASTNSTIKLISSKDNQVSQTLTFGDVGGGHVDFTITYMTNA